MPQRCKDAGLGEQARHRVLRPLARLEELVAREVGGDGLAAVAPADMQGPSGSGSATVPWEDVAARLKLKGGTNAVRDLAPLTEAQFAIAVQLKAAQDLTR